eukprot:5676428-Pleurochrysis_carterae.AAC.3
MAIRTHLLLWKSYPCRGQIIKSPHAPLLPAVVDVTVVVIVDTVATDLALVDPLVPERQYGSMQKKGKGGRGGYF